MEHEVYPYAVVGEEYPALRVFLQDTGFQQRLDIGMHDLDITADAACGFADGNRPRAAKGFEQFLALGREDLPQQLRGGKADDRSLRLSAQGGQKAFIRFLAGRNL